MSFCETLAALANGGEIAPRILAVFAHPDDETLAVGGRLEWLAGSQFLYVTDGVPLDGKDARAHGFTTAGEYRAARCRELNAAFRLAGLDGLSCARTLGSRSDPERYISDQTAALHLSDLARTLASEIRTISPDAVLTHPYEGGHPDHDACAFAVHAAMRMLHDQVPIIEAPFYHAGPAGIKTGAFLPGGPAAAVSTLSPQQKMRKEERLACFLSQRETLRLFGTEAEQYRPALGYNFLQPPHAGPLYYEGFSWGMTGERFCELARCALDELGMGATAQ